MVLFWLMSIDFPSVLMWRKGVGAERLCQAGTGTTASLQWTPMCPRGCSCRGTPGQGHQRGVLHQVAAAWFVNMSKSSPLQHPQSCAPAMRVGMERWHCHHCCQDLLQVPSVVQSGPLWGSITLSQSFFFPMVLVKQSSMGPQSQACSWFLEGLWLFFLCFVFLFSESWNSAETDETTIEKRGITALASTSLIWLWLRDVQPTDTVMKRNILKRMSQLEAGGESVWDLTGI